MNRKAFEVKTNKSDYPLLVIASGFKEAVNILYKNGIYDTDIISIQQQYVEKCGNILIEEETISNEKLREKVRQELLKDMPKWLPEPHGLMGCVSRDLYLIRTGKGNYHTSSVIDGNNYYLPLDSLEQLPGLP